MSPSKRVKELEKAIRTHRESVEAMGIRGGVMDRALWAVLDAKGKRKGFPV